MIVQQIQIILMVRCQTYQIAQIKLVFYERENIFFKKVVTLGTKDSSLRSLQL